MQDDTASASDDTRSKDEFYRQLIVLTDTMSAAHGHDFTVGTLILAARFIAQKHAPTSTPEVTAPTTH